MPDPSVTSANVPLPRLRNSRWRARRSHGLVDDRAAVDQEDVHPAVAVVVEEQPAGAHRLGEVLLGAGAVRVMEDHAGLARDVDELRSRRLGRVPGVATEAA